MWFPNGNAAAGTPMQAFAEEGEPARIPGPLIRVPAGTEAAVRVSNTLPDTLLVYGLHTRSSNASAARPTGAAARRRPHSAVSARCCGTYYYWGTTTRRAFNVRIREDAQLTGAIVVDDAASRAQQDRIFVIGMWTDTVGRAMMRRQLLLAVINGRSWPHTGTLAVCSR